MKRIKTILKLVLISLFTIQFTGCNPKQEKALWPTITTESKPWTRWWWMGSAVNEESITSQLEAFAKAGIGGVEITPIYGVKGYENQFIDFLSPQWLKMLDYTLKEAERLGLKVDMVMGTGWPYGGPQVEPQYAATKLHIQTYPLKANKTFRKTLTIDVPKQKGLASLLKVICVKENGSYSDLTSSLKENTLTYTAKEDELLYAIFCGKTRQRVKRSAPGGDGYTLDHFSKDAFSDYTQPYNETLTPFRGKLNGLFNDSYEVYAADFTPDFLNEFKQRRGYDLLDYISIINEKPDTEIYHRLLCDYRETLSDLLLDNFAKNWHQWANKNSFKTRYQAHGSPGNLIDLYASADIPECEMFGSPEFDIPGYRRNPKNIREGDFNKIMLKYCSSGAHLNGKEMVSSESFTWLRDHFKTALSHCKPITDDFFLSGINHMFLHGATYSPSDEKWPGWKFYASVNFNPNNTIWEDAPALFEYIARCQAILQKAKSDNDILLYWPIYDAYSTTKTDKLLYQFGIHTMDEWLFPTSFYKTAKQLDEEGFSFDFLSDHFLSECEYSNNTIVINNKAKYKAIVVPNMKYIPLKTLKKLVELNHKGAKIIFLGTPETINGLNNYKQKEQELNEVINNNKQLFTTKEDIETQLNKIEIYGEEAYKYGLKIIRKKLDGETIYFVANHTSSTIDKYIPFNTKAKSVLLMNPLNSKTGIADIKHDNKKTLIRIQIDPGESLFIRSLSQETNENPWHYLKKGNAVLLDNDWQLSFIDGGPKLPHDTTLNTLESWTKLGKAYEAFSGTASYSTSFDFNKKTDHFYQLNLGDVRESAKIYLNNKFIGTLFSQPYKIDVTASLKDGTNTLKIDVTNLSANRIRALEQTKKYEWKKFYEINMVDIHYKKFDATTWEPAPSGLLNNIKIISYKED